MAGKMSNTSYKVPVAIVVLVVAMAGVVVALTGELWILAFALLSFAAVFVLAWISLAIYFLCQSLFLRKHHSGLWQDLMNPSLHVRMAASHQVRGLDSPYLNRLAGHISRWQTGVLMLWLIVYIAACSYCLLAVR